MQNQGLIILSLECGCIAEDYISVLAEFTPSNHSAPHLPWTGVKDDKERDRFSGPVCVAILGRTNSHVNLSRLTE